MECEPAGGFFADSWKLAQLADQADQSRRVFVHFALSSPILNVIKTIRIANPLRHESGNLDASRDLAHLLGDHLPGPAQTFVYRSQNQVFEHVFLLSIDD